MLSRLKMLSVLATLFLLGGVFCGPLAAGTPGLVLSDAGRSDYTIVVASNASPSERHGAEELQMFLEQISGAKLPVATDADTVNGPMILVGRSKKLDELDGLEQIDFDALGDEGFVLRTAPPSLRASRSCEEREGAPPCVATRSYHSGRSERRVRWLVRVLRVQRP